MNGPLSDVIVAAIGAMQAVALVVLPIILVKLNRTQKDAREAREQVANNHVDEFGQPINLRHEADERHEENRKTLRWIVEQLIVLRGLVDANTQRIDDVEITLDPREVREARRRR